MRQHARQWPSWVQGAGGPDGQAYAVVTLCRALYTATTGEQTSKPRAARWAKGRLLAWSSLIDGALSRCGVGSARPTERDRAGEVARFVEHTSARVEDVFEARETR